MNTFRENSLTNENRLVFDVTGQAEHDGRRTVVEVSLAPSDVIALIAMLSAWLEENSTGEA